ncbi:MAG: hypothetical protein TH68_04465 [Candidatus Synechococcus spongiarum 142]|uniref:Uncharacterized protein n=1 Tax=Candidatus Synechococcus spongiarum 142 TaxID=1608213 RepID=A0A6N3X500_9SYNE|nr:MAG: hypothetical protein TH68_04465 [Candidatus Synechococcus spongiarum 142]
MLVAPLKGGAPPSSWVDRETEGLVHEILGSGISGELTRRTLLTQTDENFRERCLAAYFSRDPTQQILALASQ